MPKIIEVFSLSAETLLADDNVKEMAPTRRRCLLTNEINVPDMHIMQLFTEYKKSSCQLECKSVAKKVFLFNSSFRTQSNVSYKEVQLSAVFLPGAYQKVY